MTRQLHLNAFLLEAGHHEAAWRLPGSDPAAGLDADHFVELARIAEAALFDSVFLADNVATQGRGEFRQPGQLDPVTLLAVLAGATERIGLIATASTTYNDPYSLARRLASIDHLSGGRAGWNIVTSATLEEAANFSLAGRPLQATRYERADEFVDVAKKLWDSWADDAYLGDKSLGRWGDPARLRPIRHEGRHFTVEGPLNVPRPPQGYPLLVQAGASARGKVFAARHAEAIFVAHQGIGEARAFYSDLKARVVDAGRDPDQVLVLPGIVPIIGETPEDAHRLAASLDGLRIPEAGLAALARILEVEASDLPLDRGLPSFVVDRTHREGFDSRARLVIDLAVREDLTVREILGRLGGGRGHLVVTGTPLQVADVITEWFSTGAADGFNVMGPALPSGLLAFADTVVPILQERGLFRTRYDGTTLREHYGLAKPANQYELAVSHA